jgi:hypothetical protein
VLQEHEKNWRELCNAAIAAKDSAELMRIINKLDAALEREQNSRKPFRFGRSSKQVSPMQST